MITEASGVLARAGAGLGAPVYYKQVTIVVPPAWTEADCRVKITAPGRGLAYQVSNDFTQKFAEIMRLLVSDDDETVAELVQHVVRQMNPDANLWIIPTSTLSKSIHA